MPTNSPLEDALRASVIDRFRRAAIAPDQERKFPVGPESAKKLGYETAEVDALPTPVTESFCGAGNPFLLGEPLPGETVLDLGCRTGFDTLLAAQLNPTWIDFRLLMKLPIWFVVLVSGTLMERRDDPWNTPPGDCLFRLEGEAAGSSYMEFDEAEQIIRDCVTQFQLRDRNLCRDGETSP